ncbi:MAG TPA: cupin domain-containing protein [Patescibacteria group bacterium]|nr:cupin domain-containing protein [Patescibacteria group bacterium]
MTTPDSELLVPPGEGERVSLYGLDIVYKVEGFATAGGLSIVEHEIRPGVLVKPHVHTREDEISIVLEGVVTARIGDRIIEAATGAYVIKPRDVPHAMWNQGTVTSRVAEIVTPAGFERYFRDLAPILTGGHTPDVYRDLAGSYGITVLDDWTDEIEATYGVTL